MIYILSIAVIFLSLCPFWIWYKNQNNREAIPIFQFHTLFYAVAFGLMGFLNENRDLDFAIIVNNSDRVSGQLAVLFGLIALFLGYYKIGPRLFKKTKKIMLNIMPTNSGMVIIIYCYLPLVFFLGRLKASSTTIDSEGIGSILLQPLIALTSFIFIFILANYYQGKISGLANTYFKYLVMPIQIIIFSGLLDSQVAGTIQIAIIFFMTMLVYKKRISIGLIISLIVIIALFQPIKGIYRSKIWFGAGEGLSSLQKIELILQTFNDKYLSNTSIDSIVNEESLSIIFNRMDHLSTTASIIKETPYPNEYIYGQSYLPILTKIIPRFIWNNKPIENFGNKWAYDYGYLGSEDFGTSYNLPWISEEFINFGWAGIVFMNLIIGILFRWLSIKVWSNSRNSIEYAFGLMIGIQLVIVESNLSLMVGNIVVYSITIILILKILTITKNKYFKKNNII